FVFAVTLVFLMWHGLPARENTAKMAVPPSRIQRIVSLSPNLTEILFALGLGDRVAAVSSNCDWPAEAKTKPKVGTFWQPNTEAIIAAKPDLVVCESFDQQMTVAKTLKRTGLNILTLRVESIGELLSASEKIGQATGCSPAAEQLAAGIRNRLDHIRAMSSSARKLKVLWVVQTEPVRVAGANTFVNEIVELAGGQNAIAPTINQYPSVGTEEIISCGAEVVIQSAMGTENIHKQQIAAEQFWSRFANLPAVKNKRIYVIDADTVLRLGPRLPQGLQTTAQCLHPELFTQPPKPRQGTEQTDD
ncbi:MAG: helical backbone metal receptor, partial [Sedimentisphaerales bacterium]|nr:helical backbone metal receptor [Sedimentisphaerales bacterium]